MRTDTNPFRSERLTYRAFESPGDDDFFHAIQSDPIAFSQSCASLPTPASRSFTEKIRNSVIESSLLFVVICRDSTGSFYVESEEESDSREGVNSTVGHLEPIGTVFLKQSSPDMVHHRCTELGIDIKHEFQGQGYGTEAIRWILNWAFKTADLHRVELHVFGWNESARRLYERVGFVEEGRRRGCLRKDGKWWDEVVMGILAEEWEHGVGSQPSVIVG
jgi:RimJ/RimL family protein N-acetyltransferase